MGDSVIEGDSTGGARETVFEDDGTDSCDVVESDSGWMVEFGYSGRVDGDFALRQGHVGI